MVLIWRLIWPSLYHVWQACIVVDKKIYFAFWVFWAKVLLRKSALHYARALALHDSLLNTLHHIICTAQPTHHTHDLRILRTYHNRTIHINQYVRKYEHAREITYKDKREKLAKRKAWHATAGLIYMTRKKEREKNTYRIFMRITRPCI